MNWQNKIQDVLKLNWLKEPVGNAPFEATGFSEQPWQENTSDCTWKHASGVEATWHLEPIQGTGAAECFGQLQGTSDQASALTEALTLNLFLPLRDKTNTPWLRTYSGTSWIKSHFPPDDFQSADRQLLMLSFSQPFTIASTHDGWPTGRHLPIALLTDESQQSGFGLFVEWAGNWKMSFQLVSPPDQPKGIYLHIKAGIWGLDLALQKGESIPLPRILVLPFEGNLQAGANALRHHLANHVCPCPGGKPMEPPVFYNSWLAMLDKISPELLAPEIKAASAMGMEYFNIDAGWNVGGFRKGNGNWRPDPVKFPDGLEPLARTIREAGMKMGLWIEGEWAHKDSELCRDHPDWFLTTPTEHPDTAKPGMNFHDVDFKLMDFGLPEVRQWWLDFMIEAYQRWELRWIRWDNNQPQRASWDFGEPTGSLGRRHIRFVQGLYTFFDDLIEACPDLRIEQCASGGHRIDLGMLRRGHTQWLCDQSTHTDLSRAVQLAAGAILPPSFCNRSLPPITNGSCRRYDLLSCGMGTLSFTGILADCDEETQTRITEFVAEFKNYRHLLQGDYQLHTPPAKKCDDPVHASFTTKEKVLAFSFNPQGQSCEATVSIQKISPPQNELS